MGNGSVTETSTSALTDAAGTSSFTETYATSNSTNSGGSQSGGTGSVVSQTSRLSQAALKLGIVESVPASSAKAGQAARDEILASLDVLRLKLGLV